MIYERLQIRFTVQQWEAGTKRPSGMALKLLAVVAARGYLMRCTRNAAWVAVRFGYSGSINPLSCSALMIMRFSSR